MKKQLILEKNNDDYLLKNASKTKEQILIKNKTIEGEKIYSAFYENIDSDIEHEIVTELNDNSDKIIYNQICSLFKKIDQKVNDALNKPEN